MLPGLRFLMLATVLTCALLVFGLGAAAFLRATHDRFAAAPPWQAPREVVFAGQRRDAEATLSLLRIDTPPDATDDEVGAAPAAIVAAPSSQVDVGVARPPALDEQAIAALFPPAPDPVERDATADVLAALASAQPPSAAPDARPVPVVVVPEPEPLATLAIEPESRTAETPVLDNESPASRHLAAVAPLAPPSTQDAETTADAVPAAAEPSPAETSAALDEEFATEPIARPPLPRPRPTMTRAARQNLAAAKRARELQSARRRQAASRAAQQQQQQQQPAYLFPSLFGN